MTVEKTDEERHRDRLAAIEWARGVLADPDAVVLDVETADLAPSGRRDDPGRYDLEPCEIGVVSVAGAVLYDELLGTAVEISAGATGLHGISPAMVAGVPVFAERAYRDLTALLDGKRVIAYNIAFDRGVLAQAVAHSDGDVDSADRWIARARWDDAMDPYARWIGEWDAERGRYRPQKQPGSGHRAIADCYTTLGLLHTMAKAHPSWQPPVPDRRRPAAGPRMASERQLKFINKLLTQAGATARAERHARLAAIVGRDLASSKELTIDEASAVIDRLNG
ncbi:3'-5' exonuclease [Actinomadura parmotrematis]|uniref:3'-5' exonuclease n=1 Tax=Actinomadura parmotrematis TaxID=2864039 RepID=A0ABS7G1Z4_9ACTN|nr:3'-5' exonuclease [Actinomadura parmotrematis]MBW8486692.1 3'-5' exonuclease [Actinomadura parmotrematis]